MQVAHLVPLTFDLQVHSPLELQDVEIEPDMLQSQAVKEWSSDLHKELIIFLTIAVWIVIKPCFA